MTTEQSEMSLKGAKLLSINKRSEMTVSGQEWKGNRRASRIALSREDFRHQLNLNDSHHHRDCQSVRWAFNSSL
jgi:hypothetical protein